MIAGRAEKVEEPDRIRDSSADRAHMMAIVQTILEHTEKLASALTEIALMDSAEDEICRSVRALSGAAWEMSVTRPRQLRRVGVFLPSNNVLYSYCIFVVIPLLYADEVIIRPSARTRDTVERIHEILGPAVRQVLGRAPRVLNVSQRRFLESCSACDIVVFTGRPENARSVMRSLPDSTSVMCFGSGPNPVIVGPDAHPAGVAHDVVRARLYNSGQDCLAPDVTFVHESQLKRFLSSLERQLAGVEMGGLGSPSTQVGPIVYPDAYAAARDYLEQHQDRVHFSRTGSFAGHVIPPTVLVFDRPDAIHPPELFSPIFVVCAYERWDQIEQWFADEVELARGMYVSVYGEPDAAGELIGTASVIRDQVAFDVEDGNAPFGGYGQDASAVRHGRTVVARPLLLSAEAARCPVPGNRNET